MVNRRKYYDANIEHIREYGRKWYKKNSKKRILQTKIWRKNNPERYNAQPSKSPEYAKNRKLKEKYGINLEQFNQMLVSQGSRCGICSGVFKNSKDTCVDHDHSTGKIRQLLCMNCNIGIGKFGDSETLVESALNYLRRWS